MKERNTKKACSIPSNPYKTSEEEMGRHLEISFKEERILQALNKNINNGHADPIKATADDLGYAKHTIYTTLHRLSRRYRKSLDYGEQYRRWRNRLGKYL